MSQIRRYCEIEEDDGFVEFEDGFSVALPSGFYEFRMVPKLRLFDLNFRSITDKRQSSWVKIANVKNKTEARQAVSLFLLGLDPSHQMPTPK